MNKIKLIRTEIQRRIDDICTTEDSGCEIQNIGKVDALSRLIDFIDELPEEKPSDDVEMAAIDEVNNSIDTNDVTIIKYEGLLRWLFKAGAQWQKEQFERNRLAKCDSMTEEEYNMETDFAAEIIEKEHRQPTFSDAIKYGMELQKKQMMKDAVEGNCFVSPFTPSSLFVQTEPFANNKGFRHGETCKVIIIKEDEQ